jgi:hypothetical protein
MMPRSGVGVTIGVLESCRLLASGLAALIRSRCAEHSRVQVINREEALRDARLDVLLVGPGWPGERLLPVLGKAFEAPSSIRALVIGGVRPVGVLPPPPAWIIRVHEGHHIETLLDSVEALTKACPPPAHDHVGRSDDECLLCLIRDGLTNREIADRMFLAESTIKWRVSRLLRCNGARNRTELIRMRFGLARESE